MQGAIVYYDQTHNFTTVDSGGPYVDLYTGIVLYDPDTTECTSEYTGDIVAPVDCFNVWNYKNGCRESGLEFGSVDYDALIASRYED